MKSRVGLSRLGRAWHRRGTSRRADDDGSVLLLTLGYAVIALVLVLICVDATHLYLTHKRTDGVADAAALAGADGFRLTVAAQGVSADLTDAGVEEQAAQIVALDPDMVLVSAGTPDGVSARVTVRTTWRPPVLTLFVPDGVVVESTATSRNALTR